MSFAQEMKDFASAFSATSSVGDRISKRHLLEQKTHIPTDDELNPMSSPFDNPAPQVHSSTDGGGGGTGPEAFAQQAYDYYRGKGLSDVKAKGIAANLAQESGGMSDVVSGKRYGDAGKSGFIGQWNGKRLDKLFAYSGTKTPSLEQQLDFVLEEGNPKSPYMDKGAVKASQLADAAQDPADAVAAYRQYYERPSAVDLNKRLKWMAAINDKGAYPVTSAATPQATMKGVIPDPQSDQTDTGGGDGDGSDSEGQSDQDVSSNAGIQVNPVDTSFDYPVPQVPGWDETQYAARGGVIPAYAPGGTIANPIPGRAVNPDDYYHDNGWRPRMIGDPIKGLPQYTGLTPSQRQFMTAIKPDVGTRETPTPAAPAAPTMVPIQVPTRMGPDRGTGPTRLNPIMPGGQRVGGDPNHVILKGQNYRYVGANSTWVPVDENNNFLWQNYGGWTPIQQQTPAQPVHSTIDPKTGKVIKPAHPYIAKGGVIPAPQHFESGGSVGEGDTYTTSKSYHRTGEHSGASRGHYSAARDTNYWTPRKSSGKGKVGAIRQAAAGRRDPVRSAKQDSVPLPQPRPGDAAPSAGVIPDPSEATNAVQAGAGAANAVPSLSSAVVQPEPSNAQSVQPYVNVPPSQGPAPTERAEPVQPSTVSPVQERDFTVTQGAPHIVPVIDNQGKLIGYTPSDQNGARPDGMVGNNMPVGGVLPVPGWADKEAASAGQPPAPAPTYRGVAPSAVDFQTGAISVRPPALVPVVDNAGNVVAYRGVAPSAVDFQAGAIGARPPATPGEQIGIQQRIFGAPVYNGGYAEGGMVSYAGGGNVEGGADNNPGYTSSQSYHRPDEGIDQHDNVQPTPQLMDHVAQALDGGIKFLTQQFGIGQEQGAIPNPAADGAMQQQGIKRFASGEGAATSDEIAQVDSKLDPEEKLNEGDRQMTRLAKMSQWYLEHGRPKDAQASAASLMQYGANRFSQLGAMAAAAYSDYQQSGDKQDLKHTMKFLQSAYDMIPDGARVDVELKGDKLIGTRTTADGQTEQFDVAPDQLPTTIKSVMDKSAYWQQVFRLADPQGARQQASWANAAAVRADNQTAGRAKEDRTAARADARQQAGFAHSDKAAERAAARADARATKTSKEPIDYDKVSPLLAAVTKASANLTANKDDPAAKTQLDQSMSQLYDNLPAGIDRATWVFKNTGIDRTLWNYVGGQGGGQGAAAPTSGSVGAEGVTIDGVKQPPSSVANLPANIYKGDQAPAGIDNAKRANDGTWWVVTPGQKPLAVVVGQ